MDAKLMGEELLPQSEVDKIEAMLLDLKVVCTTVPPVTYLLCATPLLMDIYIWRGWIVFVYCKK